MDNKTVARILRETAELLQIDGAQIGRYRSYEKTGELIAGMHESIEQIAQEPEKLLSCRASATGWPSTSWRF
jgi:DNA polymerase (family 10)